MLLRLLVALVLLSGPVLVASADPLVCATSDSAAHTAQVCNAPEADPSWVRECTSVQTGDVLPHSYTEVCWSQP